MVLQKKYVRSQETPIASYDYTDIASGLGTETYYAAATNTSGANIYFLTSAAIPSGLITEKAYNLSTDRNYDIEFNLPRIINGTIYVSGYQGAFGDSTQTIYLEVNIYKVSGGAEISIDTTKYTPLTTRTGVSDSTTSEPYTLDFDTGGKIHFKKGDSLRLNIIAHGANDNAIYTCGYGIDPLDRNDTFKQVIEDEDSTQLKVLVPFDIDI